MFEEYSSECEKGSSLGFIELLNMQDFGPSVFDLLQTEPFISNSGHTLVQESPATPNYSSISSESTEHPNIQPQQQDDDDDDDDDDEPDEEKEIHKTKKDHDGKISYAYRLKAKKTNQKKQREARFAFMTKSEVDRLEDGYRWRKYGQKAVKNSPFPRSYYRCTNASCNVKKRVERSCNDPTVVVTTYEGQHTHASPQMVRPTSAALPPPPYLGFSAAAPPHNLINYLSGRQQMSFASTSPAAALLANNGLLQDMLPWSTIKKEGL